MTRSAGSRRAARCALIVVALALFGGVAGCGTFAGEPEQRSLTADFERTVGLYVSSDVRVLGVRIGKVTGIEPRGTSVRVTMTYDAKYDVPADAQAVLVAPSIVSDRYVQLTPVFQGGEVLADGAVLGTDRTDVPVELDQIFSSLNELNLALGPQGANRDGALSDLLDVGAQNLDGNGVLLNSTLKDFSTLVSTLSDQREDLFGTVANLQNFTTTIAQSDGTVRAFNRDLAAVADQLAAERQDLATAVQQLSVALGEVATFVRENSDDLTANVSDLASVTGVLVKQRAALEEFLDVAPTALSNLQLAYNPGSGTLDTRDNGVADFEANPLGAICDALVSSGQDPALCQQLTDALSGVPLPPPPGSGGAGAASAPALPGPGTLPALPGQPTGRDMTLGGILDGGR
ncbi:MAG: MCE family protein [Actinobacteria bacterium]|nr:MCE family protein [Actinomycetota bacterium]